MRAPNGCAVALTALLAIAAGPVSAQSRAGAETFDPAAVVRGIDTAPASCAEWERQETAIRVTAAGRSFCLRYYAAGLAAGSADNSIVALWLNGDILGPKGNDADKHQKGIGPSTMIAQESRLSARFGAPMIFLARPGTYGSEGRHHTLRGRPIEGDLVAAALDALKARYHVGAFVLAGHSGGGTLVAEMLTRRRDIRCAVVSSGAGAFRAYLEAHHLVAAGAPIDRLDPITAVGRIPPDPQRRIFVLGDPRETNVFFAGQKLWWQAVADHGHVATLVPLEKATDARHHDLVDFAETAMGLCAGGAPTAAIVETLEAMPDQAPRITN